MQKENNKNSQSTSETPLTLHHEVNECIETLQKFLDDPVLFTKLDEEQRVEFLKVAGLVSRPDRVTRKLRNKSLRTERKKEIALNDRKARAAASIRVAREASIFSAPKQLTSSAESLRDENRVLSSPRNCYVCKEKYTVVHHFYDTMCQSCGDLNYEKRFQTCDLTGQVALITGSRLKIGYHVTLMLLRAGATVIATTRFPADSAIRFSKEEDYHDWSDRLKIHGLDLRHIPSVEIFCNYILQQYDRLDILINNAAQTVRRPSGFYAHMMPMEALPFQEHSSKVQQLLNDHKACLEELEYLSGTSGTKSNHSMAVTWHGHEPGVGLRASAQLSQIPYSFDNSIVSQEVFPEGKLDADLQQVDLRKTNSWRLKLGEIETPEMVEVQLVNSIAPFVLINKLVNLMRKDYTGQKHVVNVSAMEGKFHRFKKEDRHPHTNMAKAALNMMTHTSAGDFAKDGIFTNAVDTGWVTDEDPIELAKRKEDLHDFQPPLDIVDGAARVMDPIFDGIKTGKHWSGKFLKDYFPIDW